jgi:hypothetical protein
MRPVTLEPDTDAPAVSAQLLQRLLEFDEAQIGPRNSQEFHRKAPLCSRSPGVERQLSVNRELLSDQTPPDDSRS